MKSSNINALFCHTNTKMPENYNFQILVHCYPIINYHKLAVIQESLSRRGK